MGFWNGVASFGLGVQGYNAYNNDQSDRAALEAKRARDTEIANIELEKLRREDALAKNVRDVASQYGLGGAQQLPATAETTTNIPQPVTISDEGEPDALPAATKTVAGLPAATNRAGMYNAMADQMEKAGKLQDAANIRAALKQTQTEGYGALLKGVASGADPEAIKQDFNAQGVHRIVNAEKNGDGSYTFTHDDGTTRQITPQQANDLGTKLGIFKKDTVIIPQGGKLVETGSGNTVATGEAKPTKIDPLSPEGIAARTQLEEAKLKAQQLLGKDATPARIREVKAVADLAFNGDIPSAVGFVYGIKDKPRSEQVLHLSKLYVDDGDKPDVAMKKAEAQIDRLRLSDVATRGSKSPGAASDAPVQLGGPGAPGFVPAAAAPAPAAPAVPPAAASKTPPQAWKDPQLGDLTFTGRTSPDGKPVYVDAKGKEYAGEFQ